MSNQTVTMGMKQSDALGPVVGLGRAGGVSISRILSLRHLDRPNQAFLSVARCYVLAAL